MPNKYFSIEGIATFVHHTGPTTLPETVPDLSRGEVVLCLHSAGGNGNHFVSVLPLLAPLHSPIAFDQPAHGRSGELDSLPSIERMAEFTGGLIERLGIERPVLLGHSMGGAVAMRYALDHPGGVRSRSYTGQARKNAALDIESGVHLNWGSRIRTLTN